ncbi:reverse transcriptase domain-containing protein [Tanacetum coccineum]
MLPIRKVRQNLDIPRRNMLDECGPKKPYRKIKRKFKNITTLTMPKEENANTSLTQESCDNHSMLLVKEREFSHTHYTYVQSPIQRHGNMLYSDRKTILALIHTTWSLGITFRKHQIKALRQSNELQAGLTPMPKAWRLYLSREEGREGMKDLNVFIDSKVLVDQVEGSRTPTTEETRKYKEEIIDATTPFHRFWITHLPLNSKAELLTGLATIKLEFLNQEVLVGIKTRPSVKVRNDDKEGKATSKVPMRKPSYN